jgi:type IV secretory pathway protease TraF
MSPENLTLPEKGFTKAERAWLKELIAAIKTVHGLAGQNVTISDSDNGQVINASDCDPCP